jgi:VanZ family protein
MTRTGKRSRVSAWAPVVLWALFLFVMSSIPGNAFPAFPPGFNVDKLVHVALYAVLGALVWRALRLTRPIDPLRATIVAAVFATLYGITDEVHQIFTPRRSADWHDVAADAVGGLLGALALTLIATRRRER